MKIFVVVFLAIGSVAAQEGYFASGWRPKGRAFYLPSEVPESELQTTQEALTDETEASGSDTLKKYGVPKLEVSLNLNQLPDVASPQTFLKVVNNEKVIAADQDSANIEATTEETAVPLYQQQLQQDAVPTAIFDNAPVTLLEQELTENILPTPAEVAVGRNADGVNNIADTIVALEEKGKAVEAQMSDTAAEITSTQDNKGFIQLPSGGFLPSGFPGFASYGVPKQRSLVQAKDDAAEITSTQDNKGFIQLPSGGFLPSGFPGFSSYGVPKQTALEANSASASDEVRKRRLSPKFRSTKTH